MKTKVYVACVGGFIGLAAVLGIASAGGGNEGASDSVSAVTTAGQTTTKVGAVHVSGVRAGEFKSLKDVVRGSTVVVIGTVENYGRQSTGAAGLPISPSRLVDVTVLRGDPKAAISVVQYGTTDGSVQAAESQLLKPGQTYLLFLTPAPGVDDEGRDAYWPTGVMAGVFSFDKLSGTAKSLDREELAKFVDKVSVEEVRAALVSA